MGTKPLLMLVSCAVLLGRAHVSTGATLQSHTKVKGKGSLPAA
jgi:hypothetical protein